MNLKSNSVGLSPFLSHTGWVILSYLTLSLVSSSVKWEYYSICYIECEKNTYETTEIKMREHILSRDVLRT